MQNVNEAYDSASINSTTEVVALKLTIPFLGGFVQQRQRLSLLRTTFQDQPSGSTVVTFSLVKERA